MIGNDIVDIAEAKKNSNWQRPRFLDKLFTTEEQQYISNAKSPFLMVWQLWSMKEAAYKLYIQGNPSRFYNPKQFECSINALNGTVRYKDFKCYVNTKIKEQCILSEARLHPSEMTSGDVVEISNPKTQSKTIKEALLKVISEQYNILHSDLKIVKSEFGIPSVLRDSKKLDVGISISHHGNYGAFCHSCESR